jgi:hypothetical protein
MNYLQTCTLHCTKLTISFYFEKEKRSLLGGVSYAIYEIADRSYGFVGFAGTSFILRNQEVLPSLVRNNLNIIDDFPYFTIEDAWEYLSERLDLTGCEQVKESVEMKKLEGRPRLTGMTVQILARKANQSSDKAKMLRSAITESFENHCRSVKILLERYYAHYHNEVYNVLKRLLIAIATDKSVIILADTERTEQRFDLLESGICHIRKIKNSSDFAFLIKEPLTCTVVHRYISEHVVTETKYTVMREYMNCLPEMYLTSAKGQAFERLVAAALMQKDIIQTLLSKITVYNRLGEVDAVPPQLEQMQFHKLSTHRHTDSVFNNRSSIDCYDALVKGNANGEMYIGDEMMGPDVIGVAVVEETNFSMHVSCKLVPERNALADDTISADTSVVTKYLRNKKQATKYSGKKRKQNEMLAADTTEMTLLIDCVFPTRATSVKFPYETMDDKALLINIDESNMELLFQDPVIIDVVKSMLANKTSQKLCSNINDHTMLCKLQFLLLHLKALFMQ